MIEFDSLIREKAERLELEAFITRHFAQLSNISQRYTGQMLTVDRDYFFAKTLEAAWARRKQLNPKKLPLNQWWVQCCKDAALSRPEWELWTITGPKVISGRRLGVRI